MRQSVAIVVRSRNGKVLAVKRRNSDAISFPGGKVEPNEGFREAAGRELAEETGIRPTMPGAEFTPGYGLSFLFNHTDEEGWNCAYFVCDSAQDEMEFIGDLGSCLWVEPDVLISRTPWPSGTHRALKEVNELSYPNLGRYSFSISE